LFYALRYDAHSIDVFTENSEAFWASENFSLVVERFPVTTVIDPLLLPVRESVCVWEWERGGWWWWCTNRAKEFGVVTELCNSKFGEKLSEILKRSVGGETSSTTICVF
jgi:hypothetical protein